MRLIKKLLLTALPLLLLFSIQCYSQQSNTCKVTKIVDGDTIHCTENGKKLKIRLIGVDAPESNENPKAYRDSKRTGESIKTIEELGKKSKAYVKSKLPIGTIVGLELDVQEKDRYGRTLAYVYMPDGTMLNELIVSAGYAQVMTVPPNIKYQEKFIESERDARNNGRGLWK